jgi:hypothetical protein
LGAVAAAAEAARQGARVLLISAKPYLGEDVCATLRLGLDEGEQWESEPARRIFEEGNPVRPMHVKPILDQALIGAGVEFLFACFVTEVLRDERGGLAGIVMANRAGHQAVRAKVVIDATERATAARLAGARFRPFPSSLSFRRVVIGPAAVQAEATASRLPLAWFANQADRRVFEYSLAAPMRDGAFASFAPIEQQVRDQTFHPGQVEAGDVLFYVPPDPVEARARAEGEWPGAEKRRA